MGGYSNQCNDSFANKTSQIAKASTSSNTLSTVVSVTGSGYLTGIQQAVGATTACAGAIDITIDGVNILPRVDITKATAEGGDGSFPCLLRFKTSLLVKHAVTATIATTTTVSYLLD